MGGIGSGRYGGKPTVEGGLVLDLNRLLRDRIFRPGTWSGSIVWTEVYSGRWTASIGYMAFMGQETGWVRLSYTTTDPSTGEQRQHDYRVELATTPQPFGGRRWWWVCPRRRDRVSKLYKPAGASTFASRRCWCLAYRSQRQAPYERAIGRAYKLRRRLGSTGSIGDPIDKPKGMRWSTYDREMEDIERIETRANGHLWTLIQRIGGAL